MTGLMALDLYLLGGVATGELGEWSLRNAPGSTAPVYVLCLVAWPAVLVYVAYQIIMGGPRDG